ncbi:hypothetical protein DAEQUDRAFT_243525 [Daedalea quercina L-15889]|uniref:Uncharacterized protein n=1 Tax=Daedalea quercina L-15889 TaxID=1314783 RepID=A0A165QSK2_9APHY|nr:hypothetical protein DAEQUDRAFT_243525 [Daedalea quercina L-15889]
MLSSALPLFKALGAHPGSAVSSVRPYHCGQYSPSLSKVHADTPWQVRHAKSPYARCLVYLRLFSLSTSAHRSSARME